jgi:hypothetical protein
MRSALSSKNHAGTMDVAPSRGVTGVSTVLIHRRGALTRFELLEQEAKTNPTNRIRNAMTRLHHRYLDARRSDDRFERAMEHTEDKEKVMDHTQPGT